MEKCKILIVDDIPTNVTLISTIIKKKLGAEYDTALSGEEALEKIDSFKPNIIILDLMMPGMDGWDVIRAVRSRFQKSEVAIIVTSAITDKVNMTECYDLGVDDYIEKPIAQEALLSAIRTQAAKLLV